MNDYEGYYFFKRDILKRKTKPEFVGKAAAEEYFPVLQTEYPTASLHQWDEKNVCICLDQRARKALIKLAKERKRDLERQLAETEGLLTEISALCQKGTKSS